MVSSLRDLILEVSEKLLPSGPEVYHQDSPNCKHSEGTQFDGTLLLIRGERAFESFAPC